MVADTAVAIGLLVLFLSTLFGEAARPTAGKVVATVLLVAPLALRRTAYRARARGAARRRRRRVERRDRRRAAPAEGTVKTRVGRLLAKLDARNRVQLVVFAYEAGARSNVTPRSHAAET
jgi:hypothetical protein